MSEKKYLIIEAYTDANIGSGALVENTIKLLKEELGASAESIRVMAHYPSVFEAKYGITSVKDFFNYPYNQSRISQVGWLMQTFAWMVTAWLSPKSAARSARWKDFQWADVVVSVGAERINDKYIKNELFSLFTYCMAKKLGKKMVIAPSTYGPFLHNYTRSAAAAAFKRLDLIFCRDQRSYDTVSQFESIDKTKLVNTSDVAIVQEWDSDYQLEMFSDQRPVVGVSVLRWTYVANSHETPYCSYESYVNEMVQFIDHLVDEYDVNIILYPTNFPVNGCREDDLVVAREIYKRLRYADRSYIVETLPSAKEFKSMMSCSVVNVTTRMHACILSTSAHIPTMSINYLFKLKEYMQGIGLGDYTIDIEDFNAKDSLEIFSRLWANKEVLRSGLEQTMRDKKSSLRHDIKRIEA